MSYQHGDTIPLLDTNETKAVNERDDCWVVTGYASVFGNTDRAGDIVMPGAFTKSLKAGLPQFLWNHNQQEAPIGAIVDAHENKRGLWFKAEMPKDDTFVRGRVMPQLRMKGLKGVSIGYHATEKETRRSDGARLLKQIKLYEISLTSMPANPLAEVESFSKSFDPDVLDVVGRALEDAARELHSLTRRIRGG